jgi:hypothetical protein
MRVHFIAPWFEYYPILCDSLRLQTHQDWTLDLIHDGPWKEQPHGAWTVDSRIRANHTMKRYGDWGHSLRAMALEGYSTDADFIIVTNADNYYVPGFLGTMLKNVGDHSGAYCDCLHSHHGWRLLPAKMKCNHIDCGSLMVRAGLAQETPWTSRRFAADWDWIESLLKKTTDFVHVPLPLHVHN